mgnify:FL=1
MRAQFQLYHQMSFKMKKASLIIFLFFVLAEMLTAQIFNEKDKIVLRDFINKNENTASEDIGEVVAKAGKYFIGTEYVAHTLEVGDEEKLIVNLSGLDCTTFMETSLALARALKKGKLDEQTLVNELTAIRYRGGVLDGYVSRLHYTSDWVTDNVKKGIVADVTKSLGGERIVFNANIMSEKPELYKRLKNKPALVEKIKEIENSIKQREYYHIPVSKIEQAEDRIKAGDLIAITSTISGVDVNHVGIAVKRNGKTYFMHAPMAGKKVQISESTLGDYISGGRKNKGIMVLRPLEP